MGTDNNHHHNNDTTITTTPATLGPNISNNNNNSSSTANNKSPPKPPIKPAEPPTPTTTTTLQPFGSSPNTADSDFISIPSYSRWFSWDNIHQCELRFLPEFFDGRSASKNPKTYKYYRNAIIQRFRDNPSSTPTKKITFTEVRKTIVGDVGSIRRVFDFLEAWGLINYSPSSSSSSSNKAAAAPQQLSHNDNKDSSSSATKSAAAPPPPPPPDAPPSASADNSTTAAAAGGPKKRLCSACKSPCTISCFTSDKHNLTLCARCYVSNNFRVGISSTDFRRVEISDVVKTDWTDKETLHLLEAIMHYGDDWKKVAEHVGGGRSDKDCVARFLKLPFGEQFVGAPESSEMVDNQLTSRGSSFQNKRMRLSPLADASNPILAQAAFLSALAGVEVAEVAAHAAVTALSDFAGVKIKANLKSVPADAKQQDFDVASHGDTAYRMDGALAEAQSELEKEEEDVERALCEIAVQTKELQDKIVHFEELDLQVERESQQLQQLKDLLYVDQLTLLFYKAAAHKSGESMVESVKAE
nr:SWI/SNF complex subunit SWI3B [Coffea arabica]